MLEDPIVIVGMARTPMGGFQGVLSDATGPELGTTAIKGALERASVSPEDIEEIILGCVLPHGQRQGPARQAAIHAGIPMSAGATTINKLCGSGMKATMLSHDLIAAGTNDVMVAGGFESMTNIPYLLPKARGGMRMGHGEIQDGMFWDGLEDAYERNKLMGHFAEDTAQHYQFTREEQDDFAIRSLGRAKTANDDGTFDGEMVPMTLKTPQGRDGYRQGRAALFGQYRENSEPASGLQQGGDRDRRQFELDLGRCRRPGHDAPVRTAQRLRSDAGRPTIVSA